MSDLSDLSKPLDMVQMAKDILLAPYRIKQTLCPLCRGAGWSPLVYTDADGYEQGERCPSCAGTGYVLTERRA